MRDLDFSPYTVLRAPLAPVGWPNVWRHSPEADAARVWTSSLSSAPGVTTASHTFALATDAKGSPVLLVEHGGGREVIALAHGLWGLPAAMLDGFALLDDRQLYATLHTFHDLHSKAATAAADRTAMRYGHAFLQGRMKKTRKGNTVSLKIKTGWFPAVDGAEDLSHDYKTPEAALMAAQTLAEARGLPATAAKAIGRS